MTHSEIFLDASFAIALASRRDQHHTRAENLAEWLEIEKVRLITTRAILLEIGSALSRQRFRRAAVELLESMANDPNVEIVALSESLYNQGFQLYRDRPDKEWGLTDCISFVVMEQRGLTEALTADMHFRQAGFRPLLIE